MPFALTSAPSTSEISEAINYLLGNFGANISADPNTGEIKGPTGNIIGYLYKYLAVKYADSADGLLNFSDSQTNRQYYGIRNSNQEIESINPADYIWKKVDGGFGTTKFLFYKVTGGRQIEFVVDTTSPGYAWQQTPSSVIDLDEISVVITATASIYKWTLGSTPPLRPATATTYTWATGAYTAPVDWDIEAPSNTTAGSFLWEIAITVIQTGSLETSPLDWSNPIYAIRAVSSNGSNGPNGNSSLTAYRVQDQASATPTFTTPTSGPNAPSGWSLATPFVGVGQVIWYIQGEYNSSTTLTINGVGPSSTRWTGPIAASIFQDIRSDNWNGSNPPSFSNPATWGTTGYYISRTNGTAILNNLGARGTLQSGSSPAISGSTMTGSGGIIYSDGNFALGNSTTNISFNGAQMTLNGSVVATQNINPDAVSITAANSAVASGANVTLNLIAGDKVIILSTLGISAFYFPTNNPATYTRNAILAVNGSTLRSLTYYALSPDLISWTYPTATINEEFTALTSNSYNFSLTFSGGGTTTGGTFITVIGLKR
jgi:hypothetical protein